MSSFGSFGWPAPFTNCISWRVCFGRPPCHLSAVSNTPSDVPKSLWSDHVMVQCFSNFLEHTQEDKLDYWTYSIEILVLSVSLASDSFWACPFAWSFQMWAPDQNGTKNNESYQKLAHTLLFSTTVLQNSCNTNTMLKNTFWGDNFIPAIGCRL